MKRLLALALILVMLLSCVPVYAVGSNSALLQGTVPYSDWKYYYSDSYFTSDASVYNPSLATMSLCLAESGSAIYSAGLENQSIGAECMMQQLGFSDFCVNEDFTKEPEMDSIGIAIAHKEIVSGGQTFTLLAVLPRSGYYAAEWANNFTLGSSGEASGFASSAAKAESFVEDYIRQYGSSFASTLKLWVVGYSRCAAVANLVV